MQNKVSNELFLPGKCVKYYSLNENINLHNCCKTRNRTHYLHEQLTCTMQISYKQQEEEEKRITFFSEEKLHQHRLLTMHNSYICSNEIVNRILSKRRHRK